MKLLNSYKNGNVNVSIYEDGTRVLENDLDNFEFDFPLSMDVKITNKCPMGCAMCHEQSTPNGKEGDILNAKFVDTLHSGTEMAIGGGAVTSHPDLVAFLTKLKEKGIIPSITVHQNEYENNKELIKFLIDNELIYGLGVSFHHKDDELWEEILEYPNAVVHLIIGIHDKQVFDYLSEFNCKILLLGYKNFGRGKIYYETFDTVIDNNIQYLRDNLATYASKFKVVSFDNLSIQQLNVRNLLTTKEWDSFYQGDDGTATMYIDLVNEEFAKTSTSTKRYKLQDDIESMFDIIKEEYKNDN